MGMAKKKTGLSVARPRRVRAFGDIEGGLKPLGQKKAKASKRTVHHAAAEIVGGDLSETSGQLAIKLIHAFDGINVDHESFAKALYSNLEASGVFDVLTVEQSLGVRQARDRAINRGATAAMMTSGDLQSNTQPVSASTNEILSPEGFEYLEYKSGGSRKFWMVKRSGLKVEVKYGRLGTNGTYHAKDFGTIQAANKYMTDKIGEKLGKGYKVIPWDQRSPH